MKKAAVVGMPYGKHQGVPIDELTDDYLWWVVHNLVIEDLGLRMDLREELEDRIKHGIYRGRCTTTAEEREDISRPQLELLSRMEHNYEGVLPVGVEHLSLKSLRARGYAVAIPKKRNGTQVEVNYITEKGKAMLRLCRSKAQ